MASEVTKDDALLEAAAQVFAEKGFDGARVDEIAQIAGVNKAMLYYRIGDKAALYAAVIRHVLGGGLEKLKAELTAVPSAEAKLRCYVRAFADLTGATRHAPPMMIREIASGGRHLPDEALRYMEGMVGTLRGILQEGVERGEFEPVNPFTTHMLIVGSLMFIAVNQPIRDRIRKLAQQGEADYAVSTSEAAEQVTELLLRGLKKK